MPETALTHRLNHLIADATVFYHKTRHYKWNVHGHAFFMLHVKFKELYNTWADVIEALAQRVRTLGAAPVHTLSAVLDLATLKEDPSLPSAAEMVQNLAKDLDFLQTSVNELLRQAEEEGDRATVDLLGQTLGRLEKDRWMFNAWLSDEESISELAQSVWRLSK